MQASDISEGRRDRHRVLELVELLIIEDVLHRSRLAQLTTPLLQKVVQPAARTIGSPRSRERAEVIAEELPGEI